MSHRVGSWSQEEDDCLLRAIQAEGARNWRRIAQLVGTRSRIQCRSRYQQYLNPTLNNNPITLEEGLLIERLVSEKGRRFREISRKLDGRSDGAIRIGGIKGIEDVIHGACTRLLALHGSQGTPYLYCQNQRSPGQSL